MTFDEYHKHRRAAKWFKPSDETGMRAFEAANPEKCPSCGVQVFDPFGRRVVIHDVERCKSSSNTQVHGRPAVPCNATLETSN